MQNNSMPQEPFAVSLGPTDKWILIQIEGTSLKVASNALAEFEIQRAFLTALNLILTESEKKAKNSNLIKIPGFVLGNHGSKN